MTSIKIGNDIVLKSDYVNLLGLRIDTHLRWSSHINYVVSRIRQLRIVFARLGYLFDSPSRILLAKAFIFPIINLYDFIYGSAASKLLRHLDVSYNDLMRSVLGLNRSQHFKLADMYALTSFQPLITRRSNSLLKFMKNVESGRIYSQIYKLLVKCHHRYDTRSHGQYILPTSLTLMGHSRVSVRGINLLNLDCGNDNDNH